MTNAKTRRRAANAAPRKPAEIRIVSNAAPPRRPWLERALTALGVTLAPRAFEVVYRLSEDGGEWREITGIIAEDHWPAVIQIRSTATTIEVSDVRIAPFK